MKPAFAVMNNTWEYNDETYSRPEGGGGLPVAVYMSRAAAEAECRRLERDAFRRGLAQDRIYLGNMAQDGIDKVWAVFCAVIGESLDLTALDGKVDQLDLVGRELWEENKSKDDGFRRQLAKKLFPQEVYEGVTDYRAQHEAWSKADLSRLTDEQVDSLIAAFPEWQRFHEVVETKVE